MVQNEQIQFTGFMNQDDPNEVIPLGQHRSASNLVFRGTGDKLRAEVIAGTREVVNASLPNTGVNTTIGRHFDDVRNRVFYFNYNSGGLHGIYIFNSDETFTTLLATNLSFADPLAFDPNYPISSIDIIYNDPVDGDILCFIDSLGRPTQINIPRYIANTYSPVKRSFIDVAKAPPAMPIKCVYENDYLITVNNVKKSLFQFIYRFVYDNLEKSVWSSGSITPLPYEPYDPLIDNNKFYNSRIALYMQTGDVDVKKIEVAFRQSNNGVISDYFLIQSFVKADLSIPDNGIFRFAFYNDGQYTPIDVKEQVLLFDFVPQKANAQALLNGNVLGYGGITEGYNLINGAMTAGRGVGRAIYDVNGALFFAIQGNDDAIGTGNNLTLYLTGVGDNDGNGNPISIYNNPITLTVQAIDTNGANVSFSVTSGIIIISSIFGLLRASAVAAGFTYVSQTLNTITFSLAGYQLQGSNASIQRNIGSLNTVNAAVFTTGFESNYDYGVIYYDAKGRTNSVITTQQLNVKTVTAQTGDDTLLPINQTSITHRPPLWASYYHLVCSKNLTYLKRFNWVSRQAFTDGQQYSGTKYAYVDISNVVDYNASLANAAGTITQGVVSYDFTVGDRIRFIRRFPLSGSTVQLTAAQYDYEILGVVSSVIANGVAQAGAFVKIKYPTADIGADFAFVGDDFQNYQISIYSYAKHVSQLATPYFEYGIRRKIGNAGTSNAYHIANLQIQSTDLTVPAIENVTSGDFFARYRTVSAGNVYQIPIGGGASFNYVLSTFQTAPQPVVDLTGNYSIHAQGSNLNSGLGTGEYPGSGDNNYFFKNNSSTLNKVIRIRTTISQSASAGSYFQLYAKLCYALQTVATNILIVDDQAVNNTGIPKLYSVDITITVPPLNSVFLLTAGTLGVSKMVTGTSLRLDVLRDIPIAISDTSFSDTYNLQLNSYSRAVSIDINAKQEFKGTLFRFSEPRQQGTNINLSNRFYPNNTDEFDRQWGAVVRLIVHERTMFVMQYRKNGVVGIYSKFIKDNSGNNNLITSDTIITPNNIQYYEGDFGIANQSLAVEVKGNIKYFADPILGNLVRLSQDGQSPISETFKVQKWAGANLASYMKDSTYQFGGKAKILVAYNQFKDRHGEIIFVLQGASDKTGYTISFDENRNAFSSFYSFMPDQIICAGNKLISWYNGRLFVHDNTNTYANFYGTQYSPSINIIVNKGSNVKKDFTALGYNSNSVWTSPNIGDVSTADGEVSNLVAGDFDTINNMFTAAFMGDANSNANPSLGMIDGDLLKGVWMSINMTNTSPSFVYLQGFYVLYFLSQKVY